MGVACTCRRQAANSAPVVGVACKVIASRSLLLKAFRQHVCLRGSYVELQYS